MPFVRPVIQRLADGLSHRRTKTALGALRPDHLRDIGLLPHDVARFERDAPANAAKRLCRRRALRAGNW